MFGRRQKKAAPVARDGDNDEDVAAREDAAAVASEIEAALQRDDDTGGTGKDKIDKEGQLDAPKVVILVCVALVILFGPNPFMDTNPPPSPEIARMNKMVEDCSKRLHLCQVQLNDCRGKGNCSPKAMAACDKLIHLCSVVNGRATGALPQQQPVMMQQQQQQQFQQQPAMMQQQQFNQEDSFNHLQEAEAMHHHEQPLHEEDSFQHLQEAEAMHHQEPVHEEEDSFSFLQEAEAMHHEPVHQVDSFQHLQEAEAMHHHEEPLHQQAVHPAEIHWEDGAVVAPVQQSRQQEAGGGGTCRESGMLLGGACVCPALHSGPACPAGAAPAPGTCACQGGMTTPFEHKDHVNKLSKRELPQAFSGPAVLDRQNPALSSGIKVHLPGKEPAWKKIGKVSAKEAKMLPAEDPVGGRVYGSCAIVGNSGVMLLEAKGQEIDSHDFVMRFNGAPTAGLERFVGSKTTVRIVNHSWQDYRESKDEIVLSHLRGPHHLEDFKLRRKANGDSEKWFLFSPDFSNYAAQTAYEVATYFGINLQAEGEQAWTPTGGWTGIVMALNLCSKVDIYGFHISERHGVPYHYHNRCPQPFAHRDSAEWMMIQAFHKHGLVEFRDPCLLECHDSDEACQECKGKNPVPRSVYEAGKAMWQKGPMPEYCSARLEWLKKEEKAGRCQGLCGKFEKKTDWGKP